MMMLAWVAGLYWWWKMGRDENLPEISLFDGYFLATFAFFIFGRVGYVLTHFAELGGWAEMMSILSKPGMSYGVGIVSAGVVIAKFVQVKEWEIWRTLDSLAVTLSLVLVFGSIGLLLNRGELPGDAIWIVWSLIQFVIVTMVRKNFRFYTWYKGENSVAQDGLAMLVFSGMVAVYYLGVSIIAANWWMVIALALTLLTSILIVMGRVRGVKVSVVQWLRNKKKREGK